MGFDHLHIGDIFNPLLQDIIRLPRLFRFLQQPLAQLISVLRAPKSKEGYAAIGGGSPLRKITNEQVLRLPLNFLVLSQVNGLYFMTMLLFSRIYSLLFSTLQANALRLALETKEVPANVYVAMRYWYPFTEEAVRQVCYKNCDKLCFHTYSFLIYISSKEGYYMKFSFINSKMVFCQRPLEGCPFALKQ